MSLASTSALLRLAVGQVDGVRCALLIQERKDTPVLAIFTQVDDDRPWLDDHYTAQVQAYRPAQRAYFVDMGQGHSGFLPHENAQIFTMGQKILVQVERPAQLDKECRLSLVDEASSHPVGCTTRISDPIKQAQDFTSARHLTLAIEESPHLFDDYATCITQALEKEIIVKQGLSIIIEETAACVAIDVNNADPTLNGFAANKAVIPLILQQMLLRNLGGQMVIDFLRLRQIDQRNHIQQDLIAASGFYDISIFGWTRLGLFELVRQRRGVSLAQSFALARHIKRN
jgi:Ribonuclease G/E